MCFAFYARNILDFAAIFYSAKYVVIVEYTINVQGHGENIDGEKVLKLKSKSIKT